MLSRCALAAGVCATLVSMATAQAPTGADVVPTNAFAFVSVKVSDLWDAESLKPARTVFTQGERPLAKELTAATGIEPADVERVTAFWPAMPLGPGGEHPFVVVTTRKPYNEARLLKGLKVGAHPSPFGPRGLSAPDAVPPKAATKEAVPAPPPPPVEKKCGEENGQDDPLGGARPDAASDRNDLFFLPDGEYGAVYLLDDRSFMFMPAFPGQFGGAGFMPLIGQLLKRKADGPLAEALKLSGKHTVVAAVQVDRLTALLSAIEMRELPQQFVPFRALMKVKHAHMTADVGAKAEIKVHLSFPDAASARRADPVFKTLLQMGSEQMAAIRKEIEKDESTAALLVPLIEVAAKALDAAEVKSDGTVVTARTEAEVGPAVTKAMANAPAIIGHAAERTETQNNLKQIGLAMHNFHDVYGHWPGNVYDENGKPLMSWRAQLLPFIEQDNLFKQLDFKKAWDDPVNKKVLDQMPKVYRVQGRETKGKNLTYFQTFFAPRALEGGSPFLMPGAKRRMADMTDGTSNTLIVVEATDPVIWLKPDDLPFDPKNLPKLGSPTTGRFQALFGDGSVREFKRAKLPDDTLRALITTNGGEVFALPDR